MTADRPQEPAQEWWRVLPVYWDESAKFAAVTEELGITMSNTKGEQRYLVAEHDAEALKTRLNALTADLATARRDHAELLDASVRSSFEIEQTLGKALGYPWYKDDQKNFPGATEADGVCVGDHVPESLALEAAERIATARRVEAENADLRARVKELEEAARTYMAGHPCSAATKYMEACGCPSYDRLLAALTATQEEAGE